MATTLEQFRERVRARLGTDAAAPWSERDEEVMLAAMHQLGWCVANNGEVYNPAPKPVINYPHDQTGFRYRGQARRRGGRR